MNICLTHDNFWSFWKLSMDASMKVRNTEIVYLFVSLLGAQINKEHILVNDWIVDTNKSTLRLVLVVIAQKMLCF